jgi:AraC-like DNA-binding protein
MECCFARSRSSRRCIGISIDERCPTRPQPGLEETKGNAGDSDQSYERTVPPNHLSVKPMSVGRLHQIPDWEKLAREARYQPAKMAAICPISLRQMQRFFARQFDKTPSEWVRELRCRLARQLISEGWSSKAVAAELGFANDSHFCHEFKLIYDVPPQSFAPLYRTSSPSDLSPTTDRRRLTSGRQAPPGSPRSTASNRQQPAPPSLEHAWGKQTQPAHVAFRQ